MKMGKHCQHSTMVEWISTKRDPTARMLRPVTDSPEFEDMADWETRSTD